MLSKIKLFKTLQTTIQLKDQDLFNASKNAKEFVIYD